jgi:hypothetical protein
MLLRTIKTWFPRRRASGVEEVVEQGLSGSIWYGWRITEWWFSRKAGSDSAEEAHTGSVPKTPKFETEAEEAQWWFDHRDEISDEFIRRAAEGTLGEGTLGRALQRQKARAESEQSPELSGLQAK